MTAIILLAVVAMLFVPSSAAGQSQNNNMSLNLSSPDGKYMFTFVHRGTQMLYDLSYCDRAVVERGELGVDIDNALLESAMGIPRDIFPNWFESLVLRGHSTSRHDSTWKPLYGEEASVRDHYNQLTLHFETAFTEGEARGSFDKRRLYAMDIEVRAYNEGLALRYVFPETESGIFLHIVGDRTSMRFPAATRAFYEEWAQGPYHLAPLHDWPRRSERPLLLHQSNGIYTAILEAGLMNFVRGKLALRSDNELQWSLYSSSDLILPFATPWRVIMCSEKPVSLINNKAIVLNLNAPNRLEETDYIRPGKAIRATKLNRDAILRTIDFAAAHNIQYVELDRGWYGNEMKMASSPLNVSPDMDFTIPEIVAYARERGVGLWLYVNQRAIYNHIQPIVERFAEWGVAGIKIGFVQVGSQLWTTWLHQTVISCARRRLMVDIHDEYRPTGISRTLPNLLTQEGIRGNEEMPDASHNTTLPFTRFLAGAADYTLCYFTSRKTTTFAHQLAMAVVYYSPLQFLYWYDTPDDYHGEEELRFWDAVPTVWDESIAVDGSPGEYIIQARRSGHEWFVGVLNGMEERDVVISTGDFLSRGTYRMELFTDDPQLGTRTNVRSETMEIRSGHAFTLHLQPSGGAAIRFVPM